MRLVWPSREFLPSYVMALERGWSPRSDGDRARIETELTAISLDADAFLASKVDREAIGAPIPLPDGSTVARLPSYSRWLWDGEFCGAIGLRWQQGTTDLPLLSLGHVGYAVVPWKQRLGYATRALRDFLPDARAEGLAFVEVTTDLSNVASRRVIEANGGVLHERFVKPVQFGGGDALRYRIVLE